MREYPFIIEFIGNMLSFYQYYNHKLTPILHTGPLNSFFFSCFAQKRDEQQQPVCVRMESKVMESAFRPQMGQTYGILRG